MTPCPKPAPRAKKAREPMKRTRIKRKQARRVAKATPEERAYLRWLHEEQGECVGFVVYGGHECQGNGEASHDRNPVGRMTGTALKESDLRTVRMCGGVHWMWTNGRGHFHGWTKQQRKVWMSARIAEHHARYEMETGTRIGEGADVTG